MRHIRLASIVLIVFSIACSRNPDQPVAATPTSPSATAARTSNLLFGDIGGAPAASDQAIAVPRNEVFTFFTNLDAKYQRMGRGASSAYVDREGVAVWTQEYIRYRVGGCDHATALQRVLTQISGGVAGGICSEPPPGIVNFPSRADSYAAAREIDSTYQRMGRSLSQMFVDLEGAVIWIQEFLRYRINACDVATAEQKVFAQIDGGPVAATCFVACDYVLLPSGISTDAGPLSANFEIRPRETPTEPQTCGWTASSDQSWLTFPSNYASGNGYTIVPYTVGRNNGADRMGRVRVQWTGGETTFTVLQAGSPFVGQLVMRDPARGPSDDVTECHLRSAATNCNFIAATNLPGNVYTYTWSFAYTIGTDRSFTVTNNSNTMTITGQCGAAGSSADGPGTNLAVQLVISDERGNAITIFRDFTLRLFTC